MSQADEDESPLTAAEEAELLLALQAALRPSDLEPSVNERLITLCLEDPLAEPSDEELLQSGRLRDALEQGIPHEGASLLHALGAAFGASHEDGAVERALGSALGSAPAPTPRPRSNVVYATFGAAAAVLAAAAAFALFIGALSSRAPSALNAAAASSLVTPHSTAPLFAAPFETGDTTARMDLIASARSRELRNNRYAAWGVR